MTVSYHEGRKCRQLGDFVAVDDEAKSDFIVIEEGI